MRRILGVAICGIFLLGAGGAFATPPGPGQCFNGATNPGQAFSQRCDDANVCATNTPECAADDSGCVPDTKDHEKCAAAIIKAFDRAIRCVTRCHCRQATALLAAKPFDEEACENGPTPNLPPALKSCREKLDAAIGKITAPGTCSGAQRDGANAEEFMLFAGKDQGPTREDPLDRQNGFTFCDSTSGAMIMTSDSDDAGWVPANKNILRCECTVGKNEGRLVHAARTCHVKLAHAFASGMPFDEEACEEHDPVEGKGALDKYNHARDVIVRQGICPPCLDQAHQDALAAFALRQVDTPTLVGEGGISTEPYSTSPVYPCP